MASGLNANAAAFTIPTARRAVTGSSDGSGLTASAASFTPGSGGGSLSASGTNSITATAAAYHPGASGNSASSGSGLRAGATAYDGGGNGGSGSGGGGGSLGPSGGSTFSAASQGYEPSWQAQGSGGSGGAPPAASAAAAVAPGAAGGGWFEAIYCQLPYAASSVAVHYEDHRVWAGLESGGLCSMTLPELIKTTSVQATHSPVTDLVPVPGYVCTTHALDAITLLL